MSKLIQYLIAICLLAGLILWAVITYFPSWREGRTNGQITEAVHAMSKYAVLRDQNPGAEKRPVREMDPFTGKPFILIQDNYQEDDGWVIVSPGPDKKLDIDLDDPFTLEKYIPYDPTNGVHSSGDILFSDDISPSLRSSVRSGSWRESYYGFRRVNSVD